MLSGMSRNTYEIKSRIEYHEVMIPDYQSLMRPVLEKAAQGEVRISDVVDTLSKDMGLTESEIEELLPSGKQTTFSNRVHWAKTYLKQAGLVRSTRRAHFVITDIGRAALQDPNTKIDNRYLQQFSAFLDFKSRNSDGLEKTIEAVGSEEQVITPDEQLRRAHRKINDSLAEELLDRVRETSPAFFEELIVILLVAMGYGGSSENAGRALGRSGDDGVDGVIDQDPLGVDQIYIQAKRYKADNSVGSGAIRDFFGGLSLKRAQKGIFVTTSSFSASAVSTARDLGSRIVLIDGSQLAKLMIRYNVGCRDEDILHLKKVDDDFFDMT